MNRNILDCNFINKSLIFIEGNYSAVYSDDSTCHGYYIMRFSLYPYNLQLYFNIDGKFIYSGEVTYEGT